MQRSAIVFSRATRGKNRAGKGGLDGTGIREILRSPPRIIFPPNRSFVAPQFLVLPSSELSSPHSLTTHLPGGYTLISHLNTCSNESVVSKFRIQCNVFARFSDILRFLSGGKRPTLKRPTEHLVQAGEQITNIKTQRRQG